MKELNDAQRDELISQYCELVVDNMDMDSLVQYAQEQLVNYFDKLSDSELEDEIRYSFDEETLNDLVNNVQDVTVLDINNTGGKY